MKTIKKWYFLAAETLVLMFIVFAACRFNILGSFEKLLTDKLYQRPRGINNKIKIIAIDDETLREVGAMGTWSRQIYADVLEELGDYPEVTVVDLMIFGAMDAEGDNALYDTCSKYHNIVAGSYINYNSVYKYARNGSGYVDHYNIAMVEQPIMADVCETGYVNAFPDDDGVLRSAMLTSYYNGETIASLSYQAYQLYCTRTGRQEHVPALENGRMNINYAGIPGDYEIVSMSKVLKHEVDPRIFQGCIVLIGAYATGLYDQYAVPNSSQLMFGVEIHANIIQALLDGKYPVNANKMISALLCALLAGIAYLLFRRIRPVASIIGTLLIIGCFILGAVLLSSKGTSVPLIYFPIAVASCCTLTIVHSYMSEYTEKKRITETLRKYVAPQVVDELAASGGYSIKLGGESRDVAVLFVDIRGFTPLSENLEPEQVVDILNSYLELTTESIFNNGGMLDKFIGDATMAVFNAPFDLDDYVFKAVKAALAIVTGGDAIESKFLEKYGKTVGFGVGVNCGKAVVGNIGCSVRMDYTAIGDTVNTAARLESNAKRGQVLISEEVYAHVKERVIAEPVGAIPLKGKSKSVFVYSLTGLVNAQSETKEKTA